MMIAIRALELFYILAILLGGYCVFRSLMKTKLVNKVAHEPVPTASDAAVLDTFERSREAVLEEVERTEAAVQSNKLRAKQMKRAIKTGTSNGN